MHFIGKEAAGVKDDKKTKINMLAILITIITVNLIMHTSHFGAKEYEFSCLYMLLYLCIKEILKEN